jgi:hypothetical protein
MNEDQRFSETRLSTIVAGNTLKSSAETALERVERRPMDVAPGTLAQAAASSPMDLIQTALTMGASLEQTKELIALARDMEQYDAQKQFFRGARPVQGEVSAHHEESHGGNRIRARRHEVRVHLGRPRRDSAHHRADARANAACRQLRT